MTYESKANYLKLGNRQVQRPLPRWIEVMRRVRVDELLRLCGGAGFRRYFGVLFCRISFFF